MGLKGIYLVLHTFRGSQVQRSAAWYLGEGGLQIVGLEMCTQKKLETVILYSLCDRGTSSEERGKRTITDFNYWDIPEKARVGQKKNDGNRLERRKIPIRYWESYCPGRPWDFLLWRMLQTQQEKAIYNMAKIQT